MHRQIEARIVNSLLGDSIELPKYATSGSAALDLRACITESVTIESGGRHLFPSGLAFNMKDPNIVAIIASRSGLALKHGVRAHPGVIDSDYHGELGILIHNDGQEPFTVNPGDRIAQLLFQPIVKVDLDFVDSFSNNTERGEGGFGHTGTK